jgi:hypothetical protein
MEGHAAEMSKKWPCEDLWDRSPGTGPAWAKALGTQPAVLMVQKEALWLLGVRGGVGKSEAERQDWRKCEI